MNRKVLPFFLLLLAWIAVGLWLANKYWCNAAPAKSISQSTIAPAAAPAAAAGWTIADNNEFTTTSPDYFGFAKSSEAHLGLSSGLESSITATSAYLKGNPNRMMDITGYYADSETNNSIMPTLGLARANDIKRLFVNAGVPSNQLNLKDALLTESSWSNDTNVTRGISLGFGAMGAADDRLEEIRGRLLGKALTVYFGTNQSRIDLSSEQRQKISDMIYYLDRVEGSGLSINGHTDSQGSRDGNLNLSKKRAKRVLDYLAGKGMSSSRMTATGFGPDEPIASNDDDDGRALNRRVEVVLK